MNGDVGATPHASALKRKRREKRGCFALIKVP